MTKSERRGRTAVAVAVAVLLVAGVAALVLLWRKDPPARVAPDEVGGAIDPSTGGSPDRQPAPGTEPLVRGQARSVTFEGSVTGVRSVQATGNATLDGIRGRVTDSAGADRGPGVLVAGGPAITLAAEALGLRGRFDIRPREVVLNGVEAVSLGRVTVTAPELLFRPDPPRGQREAPAEQRLPAGATVVVTEEGTEVALDPPGLRWADAPADLRLQAARRASFSWAGGGRIAPPGRAPLTGGFLGVKADAFAATVHRGSGAVDFAGDGRLRQAYVDGLPQLATTGSVEVKRKPAPVPAGGTGRFTWAPTNKGEFDLTIVRIRPGNDQGRWVNLALDRLPAMCGAETCNRHGGDTAQLGIGGTPGLFGVGRARPINSVILPGTGDERDISFDVPAGTSPGTYRMIVVVEGNVDPITVTVAVQVTAPPG